MGGRVEMPGGEAAGRRVVGGSGSALAVVGVGLVQLVLQGLRRPGGRPLEVLVRVKLAAQWVLAVGIVDEPCKE